MMKNIFKTAIAVFASLGSLVVEAQDLSFSQTFEAPLYLSPSFAGLTNGTRLSANYRNQWPGAGSVFQSYSVGVDHFFDRFNSGLGLLWVSDNQGKGLLVDNEIRLLYAYEFSINGSIFVRPGLSFDFGQRKVDPSKMISFADITSDGMTVKGGASIEFENLKKSRLDAGASVMVYNSDFWAGVSVDHLMRPDASFTDSKQNIGVKTTVFAGYKFVYEDSYRGSEPKSVSMAVTFKNQYSFNQLEIGAYWYYAPIELGLKYRGLFVKIAGEMNNTDAVIPNLGVNIGAFRIGYSYDMTISGLSAFGNGAHEVSLMYRLLPNDVKKRSYKMKPVPCTEPIMGYSYTGKGMKKNAPRKFFKR